MILTGPEIQRELEAGRIVIDPFDPAQLNPNSYDLRLGEELLTYVDATLDARRANPTTSVMIPPEGVVLQPNCVQLGHTVETVGSNDFVPIIRGKSSTARLGLFTHITADLLDIGAKTQITMMFHAVGAVRIYPGMLIAQITFWVPKGEIVLYDGKYQGGRGPQAYRGHRDFAADTGSSAGRE